MSHRSGVQSRSGAGPGMGTVRAVLWYRAQPAKGNPPRASSDPPASTPREPYKPMSTSAGRPRSCGMRWSPPSSTTDLPALFTRVFVRQPHRAKCFATRWSISAGIRPANADVPECSREPAPPQSCRRGEPDTAGPSGDGVIHHDDVVRPSPSASKQEGAWHSTRAVRRGHLAAETEATRLPSRGTSRSRPAVG